VDELDAAILARLQADGRMTNRDLAAALGVAPSTSLERVRALRHRGVLTGFSAEVDLPALGRSVQALISVRLRPQSRATIHGFRDFVAGLPETLQVFVVTGDEDVLVHVGVRDTRHLQDFVLDRITQRSEIAALRTTVVFDHHRSPVVAPLPGRGPGGGGAPAAGGDV